MTLLVDGLLADGRRVDLRCDATAVTEVAPARTLAPGDGEDVVDVDGALVLPAAAEPHAHLDKALTADAIPNPVGDLLGAIEGWRAYTSQLTPADIEGRAERAARLLVGNGCTAIRTHIDTGHGYGTMGVEALVAVRERVADQCDLEIVALPSGHLSGPEAAATRTRLVDALAAGADVVGGCPHLDPDPAASIAAALEVAAAAGVAVDLHTDETLDPTMLSLAELARQVSASGFPHPVAASHCVSLGVQDEACQREVAEAVAAAGIAIVALPLTNLFLQGRAHAVATPRGLTAVAALRAAGAVVAAGADNLQDPFNTMGRGDPLETAALMVMAGHLTPVEAYASVSSQARRAMALPAAESVAVGAPAELVALRAPGVRAAIADAPHQRWVLHHGRVVGNAAFTPDTMSGCTPFA